MKLSKQMSNLWNSGCTYTGRYENLFEYDANGNILRQERRDAAGAFIDQMDYRYAKQNSRLHHNRLYHINDSVNANVFDDDIDDMGTFDDTDLTAMMFTNNYVYDAIGNLIKDEQEEIDSMVWRPDGKLEKIIRSSSSGKLNLKFDYDVSGNRIAKHVIDNNDELLHSTYYVRDAQGNVMSVYKLDIDTVLSSLSFAQKERHIYGSSMLGMDTDSLELISPVVGDTTLYSYLVGNKRYSMSNHLGNVLAVVTDKKLPIDINQDTLVDYYLPEVFSTSDYSPFGVILDGRNFNSEKFRYSFNFQEKVSEIAPEHHTAEFWEYDPRSARRWNVDPVVKSHESSYATFANNPILFIDPNGADTLDIMKNDDGKWNISKTQIAKGDDVFRVHIPGSETPTIHKFSEGEYGKRMNVLNLENTEDYTLGVYHISGAEGEGAVGFAVTPGGEPSTVKESNQRLPDDVYTINPPYSHDIFWVQPNIAVGEKSGDVSGRGTRIHSAPSKLQSTGVKQWTKSCFVVSTDYSIKNGQIYFNSVNSMQTSKKVNTFLGATKHYDSVGKKNRPGSDFGNGINVKLIQKSGF